MMPNDPKDPNFNNKKRHIGNDFVNIIYWDDGHISGDIPELSVLNVRLDFLLIIGSI